MVQIPSTRAMKRLAGYELPSRTRCGDARGGSAVDGCVGAPSPKGCEIDLDKVFAKYAFNLDRILEFEPRFPRLTRTSTMTNVVAEAIGPFLIDNSCGLGRGLINAKPKPY
jgi:hypothetical protein